ncbi:MAG: ROK family protein [bacterium]|nr:ROK family protein [bacterium]
MTEMTVGIDVGGSRTRVGAVDALGRVHALITSPTPRGGEALIGHLVAGVNEIEGQLATRPVGCGVGVPGKVDEAGGLSLAVNLGIDQPLALRERLVERMGMPVRVDNDVNVAAYGAARLAGLERGTLFYLNVGTGLAAGVCIDGIVHRGLTGGAGEVGHMPLIGGPRPCKCGQRGCAEVRASGSAIIKRWGQEGASVADVWDAADRGDVRALAIRSDALNALATLILCGLLMLDADIVMIGGGVAALGNRLKHPLLEQIETAVDRSPLLASYGAAERLELADPETEYGVIGSSWMARSP